MSIIDNYYNFIESKKHISIDNGIEPVWMPEKIFDFQQYITEKALKHGRMGVFLDTGLGKTRQALTIAYNMVLTTNQKVLILTPLAVAFQFLKEAEIIGIDDIEYSKNGTHTKKIVICNYERLHNMNSSDFICVICDESSILKNFNGKIKFAITGFVKKIKFRYLMSATPSPNDYTELGTSSEALGNLGYMDMLTYYFHNARNDKDSRNKNIGVNYYLKPHAKENFFSWINTWALMIRKPSDIGFSDEKYILPELIENIHYVHSVNFLEESGQITLLPQEASSMWEVRHEQKQTEPQRCELAVEKAFNKTSVYWCNTNNESIILKKLDNKAVEIIGSQSIEEKEEILKAFSNREIKRIITKSSITGVGMNWQHCNHSVFFPTWSYEQYYQSIRRFWRFGQTNKVIIDLILSDGQKRVIKALMEKKEKANHLYDNLISNVCKYKQIENIKSEKEIILPSFLEVA